MPLLDVEGLRTHFHTREGTVQAVRGVSFHVNAGETLGIVGESGSGKSVAVMSLLKLLAMPPARIEAGTALFDGTDLLRCSTARLRRIRGKRIAMVFQDPMTALNPYMTIGGQVMEPLRLHENVGKTEARHRAGEALQAVGIQDGPERLGDYPHEFSGGMRQRVMIAAALVTNPALLIADEPTTALDVTVQAQILDLIRGLQERHTMGMILITHDLAVVAATCDRVMVMYAGRFVETAPVDALFARPRHPYTEALLKSLPSVHAKGVKLTSIPGSPPDPVQTFPGCPFVPRCPYAAPMCGESVPGLEPVDKDHASACLRVQAGEL